MLLFLWVGEAGVCCCYWGGVGYVVVVSGGGWGLLLITGKLGYVANYLL